MKSKLIQTIGAVAAMLLSACSSTPRQSGSNNSYVKVNTGDNSNVNVNVYQVATQIVAPQGAPARGRGDMIYESRGALYSMVGGAYPGMPCPSGHKIMHTNMGLTLCRYLGHDSSQMRMHYGLVAPRAHGYARGPYEDNTPPEPPARMGPPRYFSSDPWANEQYNRLFYSQYQPQYDPVPMPRRR